MAGTQGPGDGAGAERVTVSTRCMGLTPGAAAPTGTPLSVLAGASVWGLLLSLPTAAGTATGTMGFLGPDTRMSARSVDRPGRRVALW